MQELRSHGITKDEKADFKTCTRSWYYEQQDLRIQLQDY